MSQSKDLDSTPTDEISTTSQESSRELTWRSGLAAVGSALAYFLTAGFQNAYGIFQEYYRATYLPDKTNFQISWIGSFNIFCLFAFAPVAGILTDKIGPTIPIAAGSTMLLVAIFMVSLCKEYWQFFLAQGMLLGIGMCFIAIPASGMVPRYFKRNRGLATGFTVAGSSLGGVIWPIVFNQLLHRDGISFPWAMRIAGFIMTPLSVICILTIRPPLKSLTVPTNEASRQEKGDDNTADETQKGQDMSVLRKPPFILLCSGLFVAIFGFFDPFFYVSTYAVSHGMSPNLAFYLVSVVNSASFFGRILPGFVADKWGRFNMLAISAFTSGVIAFCWTAATSTAELAIWTATYGFASGAVLSLQLACATTLVDHNSAGAAVGATMGSISLAALFGTPIAGELVKSGYGALSYFSGTTMLAGAALIAASRFNQNRRLFARV